jgi:phage baseplate assembly protein gpV
LPPLDGAEAWAFPYRLGQRARVRLTVMKNVRHAGGDVVSAGSGSAEDQAKRLAAQLLSDARKEEQK